ncbi:MAG: rod-binding protein [Deltaproteobacteria bacterium]|nr:rod-binding protein [Deltaproteobacteria bacterium]
MKGIGSVQPLNMNIPGGGSSSTDKSAALKKAVTEFEALFINQMLKVMRDTVTKSKLFHGGSGEEIYDSLLDTELSNQMAKGGGIGLAKVLLGQFEKISVVPDPTGAGPKTPGHGEPQPQSKAPGVKKRV